MKYLSFFLLCGVLAACTNTDKKGTANNPKVKDSLIQVSLTDSSNYTTIQWLDSVEQNLGQINEGQVVEIAWNFKNAGTKPLVFAAVRPGCGCTIADRPQEPIAPGAQGVIKAKFESNGHPNMQRKQIFIVANNRNRNNVTDDMLTFTVNVIPKK